VTGASRSYGRSIGDLLRLPWGRKGAQIVLAVCCFALPVLFIPLASHESGTDLWVRAGLSKSIVKKVLIPGGTVALRYVLTADRGVYRSTDNGMTWLAVNNGLPSGTWGSIEIRALAVDESNPSVIYAGMASVGRTDDVLSAGLYLSRNSGTTWMGLGRDMAGKEVQAIAVMPAPALADRPGEGATAGSTVCVATVGEIYCSTDEGQSWSRLDWRGVEIKILSLAIRSGNPRVIYVGTEGGGIYGTENGGTSWVGMNQGLDNLDIHDIAISITEPRLMYLATDGGVYKSADAGSTWAKLAGATKGRHVYTIALHPQDQNVSYAGLRCGAAYCSTDGGLQWMPLKRGLGDLTIWSLALDSQNPSLLWAGTTDGVWRYVLGAPVSSTAIPTVLVASAMPEPKPTCTATPRSSATPSPTEAPTLAATLTPIVTRTPSPTATHTPMPTHTPTLLPTHTPTLTPTFTVTAVPLPPTSVPPPTETPVPR